jgi:hypothetical protein
VALGLLSALGDASIVVDMLAGAGLGAIAGNLVAERARAHGRRVDASATVRRWSLFGAGLFVLGHVIAGLTSWA